MRHFSLLKPRMSQYDPHERMPNKGNDFLDNCHTNLQRDNVMTEIWNTPLNVDLDQLIQTIHQLSQRKKTVCEYLKIGLLLEQLRKNYTDDVFKAYIQNNNTTIGFKLASCEYYLL